MPLEYENIQGLVFSGYADLEASMFWLLKFSNRDCAKHWLRKTVNEITFGRTAHVRRILEQNTSLNLALSFPGIRVLGISDADLALFSTEFREGMVTPHRQRVLGDLPGSKNDPFTWGWGGPVGDALGEHVHGALLLYAKTAASLDCLARAEMERLEGVEILRQLPTISLSDNKEHFGFHDGISDPIIRGTERNGPQRDVIEPGEFILGYQNESGETPQFNLLRNGTYLVMRQLEQDVEGFWHLAKKQSGAGAARYDAVTIASKCVGRWPDGTPLHDGPTSTNDFDFVPQDRDGFFCPLGSHIRRANPRGSLLPDQAESIQTVKRHRVIRRGRSYGRPVSPAVYPEGVNVTAKECVDSLSDTSRGLYFICLNAKIREQFEFIHQTWINNAKFSTVYDEPDPLIGAVPSDGFGRVFSIQARPIRRRIVDLPQFVRVVGGSYFFLPSRQMLELVSSQ